MSEELKAAGSSCITETVSAVINTFNFNELRYAEGRWTREVREKALLRIPKTANLYAEKWYAAKKDLIKAFDGKTQVPVWQADTDRRPEKIDRYMKGEATGNLSAEVTAFLKVVSEVFWDGLADAHRGFRVSPNGLRWDQFNLKLMPFFFMNREERYSGEDYHRPAIFPRDLRTNISEQIDAVLKLDLPADIIASVDGARLSQVESISGRYMFTSIDGAGAWDLLRAHDNLCCEELREESSRGFGGAFCRTHVGVNFSELLYRLIALTPFEMLIENKTPSGMKFSKFIKTLFNGQTILMCGSDGRSYFEQFDILWSQVIQRYKGLPAEGEKDIENPDLIISVNPMDYMFMSVAKEWSSCHELHKQHAMGGFAYMIDPCTVIIWAPRKKKEGSSDHLVQRFGITARDKVWRQICHIDLKNGSAVFGREFPSPSGKNAQLARAAVAKILADYHGVTPAWTLYSGTGDLKAERGFAYIETKGPMIVLNGNNMSIAETTYGAARVWCPVCGRFATNDLWVTAAYGMNNGSPGTIACSCCLTGQSAQEVLAEVARRRQQESGGRFVDPRIINPTNRVDGEPSIYRNHTYHCDECGSSRRGWNISYRADAAEEHRWICRYCIERMNEMSTCPDCNHYFNRETTDNGELDVGNHCSLCWIRNHEYACDQCGELFDREDEDSCRVNDDLLCPACSDEMVSYCVSCGDYVYNDDGCYYERADAFYCDCCAEEVIRACSVCGEDDYYGSMSDLIVDSEDGGYYRNYLCGECRAEQLGKQIIECEACRTYYDINYVMNHLNNNGEYDGGHYDICGNCRESINTKLRRRREEDEASGRCGAAENVSQDDGTGTVSNSEGHVEITQLHLAV